MSLTSTSPAKGVGIGTLMASISGTWKITLALSCSPGFKEHTRHI